MNVLGARIPALVLAIVAAILGYIFGRKHQAAAAAAA